MNRPSARVDPFPVDRLASILCGTPRSTGSRYTVTRNLWL